MNRRYYMLLPLSLLSYLSLVAAPVLAAQDPILAKWSTNTYGPDGPWPAVEVVVGKDQKISMYPGRTWASILISTKYCSYNTSAACQASTAGLYNKEKAEKDRTGSNGSIQYKSNPDYMSGLPVKGDKLTHWMDRVNLQDGSGAKMDPARSQTFQWPYWASRAADTINQMFTTNDGPAINASLIPGDLYRRQEISSNPFGMLIGSVNPKMDGSLYFGGYDQNRVVGDILALSTENNNLGLSLKDIAIKVVDGSSPWSFGATRGGLLAQGNPSIGSQGVQVQVDGCSPYLALPKSTCDAIAQHLPVTYNAGLGLYTWNADDAKYAQIVGSASALEFSFLGSSNTQRLSISVPFHHLNLTLEAPLVAAGPPQPYFPCFTGADSYSLGKAFLQDAFLGANWGAKTWFLAQAPGPNVPSSPNVVPFAGSDAKSIMAGPNDWKESWAGSWKALTPAEASTSTGAKAGIGIGAGVGALAAIGAFAFFLWSRHRKAKKGSDTTEDSSITAAPGASGPTFYKYGGGGGEAYHAHPHNQYAPPGYEAQQQAYAAELPGAYDSTPSELPAPRPPLVGHSQ